MPVRLLSDLKPRGKFEERPFQTPVGMLVHATTESSIPKILREGIKPRGASHCVVWPDYRVPHHIEKLGEERIEEIIQCREEGVYFFDDYADGVGQGLATVGFLKDDEPALLVVNVKGLELLEDPEFEYKDESVEAQSYYHPGTVHPERIECVCRPKRGMRPSTGALMCRLVHLIEDCELGENFDTIYEQLSEISNWECDCKK